MTEFTLALPLLLMFIVGIVDLTRAVNAYFIVSQICRESVRTAAAIEGLEVGTFNHIVRAIDERHCNPTSAATTNSCLNQLIVQTRARQFLEWHGLPLVANQTFLSSELVGDNGSPLANSVVFRITAQYEAIFPLFDNLTIARSVRSPYLYVSSGTVMAVGCPPGSPDNNCQGV
ncbi:MAG: pilus assembly protein [bacterium]|nr:pilus assembly protein [bacterium]